MMTVSKKEFDSWRRNVIVGWIILLIGVGLGFARIESTANEAGNTAKGLASLVSYNEQAAKNQQINRTSNVAVWCGAINENRIEARRLGGAQYSLPNLNCKQLEEQTARSSTVKLETQAHINLKAVPW